MDNQQSQTLISTLMQGGLASSEGEARRMAEDMLGTTAKVQEEYAQKKEKINMFANEIAAKGRQSPQVTDDAYQEIPEMEFPETKVEEPIREAPVQAIREENQSIAMQSKIQELRNAALNPEPVNIQVNFQTPKTDRDAFQNNFSNQTIEPTFSQEEANQAVQNNIQNNMPSVDFQIPGIDNNITINELAGSAPQQTQQQDDFFSQQQSAPQNFIQQEQQVQEKPIQQPSFQNNNSFGLQSGFPTSSPKPIQQSSDFLQVKEEPKEIQQQSSPQQNTQSNPSSMQNSQNNESAHSTPSRNPTWTEEERKLKEDVDLSKIFNFSNK